LEVEGQEQVSLGNSRTTRGSVVPLMVKMCRRGSREICPVDMIRAARSNVVKPCVAGTSSTGGEASVAGRVVGTAGAGGGGGEVSVAVDVDDDV